MKSAEGMVGRLRTCLMVCGGALIPAKAGLLDNLEAITHLMAIGLLKSIADT
jgi:transcriptional regulator GlxA family with amidase domain